MRPLTELEQQILVAALKEHLYTLTIDNAAQSHLKKVNQIAEAVCFGLIVYDDDKENT